MPLVRNTETGNNYLEKINTGGDMCSKTAVRSYDKQLGSQGTEYPTDPAPPAGVPAAGEPENYLFSLPFYYLPASYTLWVYVNGQKAEYKPAAGDTAVQRLEYQEPENNQVLFWYPLQNDDIIEFIVAGAYDGEVGDALIPDLSSYKTVDATNIFTANQPMNSYKFTGLGYGTADGDSVRKDQLGSNFYNNVHFHTELHDNTGNNPLIQTSSGVATVTDNLYIQGTLPVFNMLDTNDNDGQWTVNGNVLSMNYRVGTGAWNTVATFGLDSNKQVNLYGQTSLNGNKLVNVADGTINATSTDAIAARQLLTTSARSIPTVARWMPTNIATHSLGVGGGSIGGGSNYNLINLVTTTGITGEPAWARGILIRVRTEIDMGSAGTPVTGPYGVQLYLPIWDTTGLMSPPYVKGALGLQEEQVVIHGNASDTYTAAFTDTTINDVHVVPFNDEWEMFYYWYSCYAPVGMSADLSIDFIGFYR